MITHVFSGDGSFLQSCDIEIMPMDPSGHAFVEMLAGMLALMLHGASKDRRVTHFAKTYPSQTIDRHFEAFLERFQGFGIRWAYQERGRSLSNDR